MIGLLLSALNPFKMILFWGLKKIPLLLEIPTLKDHLMMHSELGELLKPGWVGAVRSYTTVLFSSTKA